MNIAVIVGGGVAGILCALLLQPRCRKVYLIEKGNRLGGMFQSRLTERGLWFDYGFRITTLTGIPNIDALMIDDDMKRQMRPFTAIKSNSFFRGVLNRENGLIDASALPGELYRKGLDQFSGARPSGDDYHDLEEQLLDEYGETYTEEIFRPIYRKFTCHELDELEPGAQQQFPIRFRDRPSAKIYERLHGASVPQGASVEGPRFFYPLREGINAWTRMHHDKLRNLGVEVLLGESVRSIRERGGSGRALALECGGNLECDMLVWTGPFPHLAKAIHVDLDLATPAPTRMSFTLHHMAFDRPLLSDCQNMLCHDHTIAPWRVTFYQNIQNATPQGLSHITAETIFPLGGEDPVEPERVQDDLVRMGLLHSDARLEYYGRQVLPGAMPVYSRAFVARAAEEERMFDERFSNVIVPNKPSPATFFSNRTLPSCYTTIAEHIEEMLASAGERG